MNPPTTEPLIETMADWSHLLEGSVLSQELIQFAWVKVDNLQSLGQDGELQSYQPSLGQAAFLVGQAVVLGRSGREIGLAGRT